MDGTEINQFVVAACVASELHYAQYFHPGTDSLDCLADLLKVDPKAIKAKLDAEAKAAKKEKEEKARPKSKAQIAKKAAAAPTAKPAVKKTAKAKPTENQLDLAIPPAGGLTNPQEAWPFPTKGETMAQAQARAAAAGKARTAAAT